MVVTVLLGDWQLIQLVVVVVDQNIAILLLTRGLLVDLVVVPLVKVVQEDLEHPAKDTLAVMVADHIMVVVVVVLAEQVLVVAVQPTEAPAYKMLF
jgi:hypothetical protein